MELAPGTIFLLPNIPNFNQKIDKIIALFYHNILW